MEVAWQAYYDPHRVNLADFVAPGRQDLSYLGLELVVGVLISYEHGRRVLPACRIGVLQHFVTETTIPSTIASAIVSTIASTIVSTTVSTMASTIVSTIGTTQYG